MLKEYKLPEKYEVARIKYMDSTGKTVFNDYHSKETNPGYSRNNLGGFYTKWFTSLFFITIISNMEEYILTEDDIKCCINAIEDLDDDGNGYINVYDFDTALDKLGI